MGHLIANKVSNLPSWDSSQLRLFTMLAEELTLPLSFVSQVNELMRVDSNARDNDNLLKEAQKQFEKYLGMSEYLECLNRAMSKQIELLPMNPLSIVDQAVQAHVHSLKESGHVLKLQGNTSALVLGHALALKGVVDLLLRTFEETATRASRLTIDVSQRLDYVNLIISDTKSILNRSMVKQMIDRSHRQSQTLAESRCSALPIVLAQELTRVMNGNLDFQRRRGQAQWIISLPISRQLALWD